MKDAKARAAVLRFIRYEECTHADLWLVWAWRPHMEFRFMGDWLDQLSEGELVMWFSLCLEASR